MTARGRLLLILLVGAGYAAVSQWLMLTRPESPIALLVVLGPLTGASLFGLWQRGSHLLAGAATAAALALCIVALRHDLPVVSPQVLYLLQHAGIHAALAIVFGSTLRAGSTPLITRLAMRMHPVDDAIRRYTRRVTWMWTGYFLAMVLSSLGLFALSFDAWTWFASVFTPVSAVAVFVGEHLLRYRLHPEFKRVTLATAWQAWQTRVETSPMATAATRASCDGAAGAAVPIPPSGTTPGAPPAARRA